MQYSTNIRYTLPSAATALSLTPGGVWTFGSWVEATPATDTDWCLAGIVNISNDAAQPFSSGNRRCEVQVGVGAGGAEVVIATFKMAPLDSSIIGRMSHRLHIPIDLIPSGSRVALRMRHEKSNTTAWTWALEYLKKPIDGTMLVTDNVLQVAPFGTSETVVTAGTGSTPVYSWGAYATVLASAASDIAILGVGWRPNQNGDWGYIELAKGAASSEVTLAQVGAGRSGLAQRETTLMFSNPITGILSGDRISARYSSLYSGVTADVFIYYTAVPL